MSEAVFENPISSLPEKDGHPAPLELVSGIKAELQPTPAGKHRIEHGLCYKTDCVQKYGMPFIMRSTVYFTPHEP